MQKFKIDSPVQTQANNALSHFDKSVSISRRKRYQKRIDYYYGIQERYLEDAIKTNFKYPERLNLQREYDDLTRFLTDQLAVLYSEQPIRKIVDGSEKDEEIMNQIWEDSKINIVMQTVNKLTKLCKTVLLKVSYRDGKIQYDVYTPNIFDVITKSSDNTKADAIIYAQINDTQNDSNYTNNDKTRINEDRFQDRDAQFFYWTEKDFISFSRAGKMTRLSSNARIKFSDENENFENPYGILPFVVVRDEYPTNGFYIEGNDDLINKNEIINQKLTEKNYLTKTQAFSQLVRKGAPDNSPSLVSDPSMTIDIPSDTEFGRGNDVKYITPDAKIQELQNDVETKKRDIAMSRGLNPDMFTASAERSSADSIQLNQANQARIIQQDKPFYTDAEQELFNITRIVWNTENAGNQISENAKLAIDYKEVETIMTIQEEDQHNILLEQNGLISKVDWLMKNNPDIQDRKSALEQLIMIAEETAEIAKVAIDLNPITPEPEELTEIDEEEPVEDDA